MVLTLEFHGRHAMATRDADAQAPTEAKRLQFGHYVLDLRRGCLLLDGAELALRPKTFAVLCYLAGNSGRLISKDELFAAVWPNLAITDDALVQSIGELRRALKDDGPRLIKTVPRRGYRFEPDGPIVSLDDRSSADAAALAARMSNPARARGPVPGGRPRLAFFTTAPARLRLGLSASLMLAVVLTATALWSGFRTDWKFLNIPGYGERPIATSSEIGARPGIAILPLVDQSDGPAREYFADGLTQDIINAMGRFSELTVVSWNAVAPYKGKPASP